MSRLVVVPNYIADAINAAIDKAIADTPDAAKDRDYFYQVLLDHFDQHGVVPEFSLEPRRFVIPSPQDTRGISQEEGGVRDLPSSDGNAPRELRPPHPNGGSDA